MAVTIFDIGKKLGLSHTTVSRVLNGSKDIHISAPTRERVLLMAKEMGYRPNRAARSLATGKTHNIALFTEGMTERTGPHFARMLEAVERKAIDSKYRVLVCGDLTSVLDESAFDGIILLADPLDPLVCRTKSSLPMIFVYNRPEVTDNCISWSDFEGAQMAVEYLIGLGHKKIAAVLGGHDIERELEYAKVHGFRHAMRQAGLPSIERWGRASPDWFEDGYLLTKDLVASNEDFTGVFCTNDFVALGTMKALHEVGLSVPGDVSVIGYNDTSSARCSDPGLTSVHTPIAEAGEMAVDALVKAIESGEREYAGTVLRVSLTVRESCAPLKGRR